MVIVLAMNYQLIRRGAACCAPTPRHCSIEETQDDQFLPTCPVLQLPYNDAGFLWIGIEPPFSEVMTRTLFYGVRVPPLQNRETSVKAYASQGRHGGLPLQKHDICTLNQKNRRGAPLCAPCKRAFRNNMRGFALYPICGYPVTNTA
jgi:hypothetical protein